MKKIFNIGLIIACMLFLSSCQLFAQIEDTNGPDNYELETLNDYSFLQSDQYKEVKSISTFSKGTGKFKAGKISGVKTLYSFKPEGKTMTLTVTSSITSGNFRIVLVSNKEIVHDFEINGTATFVISDCFEKCYLKIGAESANVSMEYTIK